MQTLVLASLAAVVVVVMSSTLRWWATALITTIVSITLVPRSLGIELGPLSLNTYDVVILGALLIASLATKHRPTLLLFAPLIAFLLIGALFQWEQNDEMWQSLLFLVVGMASWSLAQSLAAGYRPGSRHDTVIVVVVSAVIVVQVVVTVLQAGGVPIFELQGRSAELEGGRASGTFSHPGTVGKVMILLAAIMLPFTQSARSSLRRIAYMTSVLALVPVGLSESRANFVGYLLVLGVWFITMPGRSANTSRFLIPAAVAIGGLAFAGTIIERFANDPAGGARQHFTDVAISAIVEHPWLGVGPGNYVPVIGRVDALTADGWRVHNVFLLQTAELGIVGGALFFLPAVVLTIASLSLIRSLGLRGVWARAYLAAAAGSLVTAVTGWGLMNGSIFMLWFFCMGFSYGIVKNRALEQPEILHAPKLRPITNGGRAR